MKLAAERGSTIELATGGAAAVSRGVQQGRFSAGCARARALIAALLVLAAALLLPSESAASAAPSAVTGPVGQGIWISFAELSQLPMTGGAWKSLKSAADGNLGSAQIANQDSSHDVSTLAVALVYARTGTATYRQKAADAIQSAIGTEAGGRTLALGRNLVSYVIAADLINLRDYDPAKDQQFRSWLGAVRTANIDGDTLVSTHESRANNWGNHAGASRVAADAYLGDLQDLARAAAVFKGWLGDRASYAKFGFGDDLSWQVDPSNPVGINPAGAAVAGHLIDGALPDEMRRGCGLAFPPCRTSYPWGGLEGAVVEAELLYRQGYDAWSWQDQALRRAVQFLYDLDKQFPGDGWWAPGDDVWQPWLVNFAYGTSFPTTAARSGKNMGWTDWTHAGRRTAAVAAPPAPSGGSTGAAGGTGGVAAGGGVVGGVAGVIASFTLSRCTITGTEGDDRLVGTEARDIICGLGGDDRIVGRGASDVLVGGDGNDRLLGSGGGDGLLGGGGNDKLEGQNGSDILLGGPGDDGLDGSAGRDRITGGAGADRLNGGADRDSLVGGDGNDLLDGEQGDDLLHGGPGDDDLLGGSNDDELFGGAGLDVFLGGRGADLIFAQDGRAETVDGGPDEDSALLDREIERARSIEVFA